MAKITAMMRLISVITFIYGCRISRLMQCRVRKKVPRISSPGDFIDKGQHNLLIVSGVLS